jgi:hypothetical protein
MPDYLFHPYDLREMLQGQEQRALGTAAGLSPTKILGSSLDELLAEILEDFELDEITLHLDQVTASQSETQVDVSSDWNRVIHDRSRPFKMAGTTVTFFVPFTGDPRVFACKPGTWSSVLPTGLVRDSHIEIEVTGVGLLASDAKRQFDSNVQRISQYVGWANADVAEFNSRLPTSVQGALEHRLAKVQADQSLVADLGVPIRKRDDVESTFVTPEVRRKPSIRAPKPTAKVAAPPEPVIASEMYEHILGVLQNMVGMMERSPTAFASMKEEDLRNHFLVQLNGHYEGNATGETFNFEGKTDILIRVDGRTVFIAECKFWAGPKRLAEAVDQLLGYTSWRDTKTALLIFNRERNFSAALSKISPTISAHPNFVREIEYGDESTFRFVVRHRDDPDRHLTLTVLAFELPEATGATAS